MEFLGDVAGEPTLLTSQHCIVEARDSHQFNSKGFFSYFGDQKIASLGLVLLEFKEVKKLDSHIDSGSWYWKIQHPPAEESEPGPNHQDQPREAWPSMSWS